MFCSHRKVRIVNCELRKPKFGFMLRNSAFGFPWFGDDRGVAALEGILVFALLAGVFLVCLLLAQWGTSLQNAQMGARLMAFDAGDADLAGSGSHRTMPRSNSRARTGTRWSTARLQNWLGNMFTLSNGGLSGSVTDGDEGARAGSGVVVRVCAGSHGLPCLWLDRRVQSVGECPSRLSSRASCASHITSDSPERTRANLTQRAPGKSRTGTQSWKRSTVWWASKSI